MPYDFSIDTWSIGCTLFELYTGKILFTGRTNNQMLRSIMECRGKFSLKMLKKAEFAGVHFDENLHFRSMEKDKVTGRVRTVPFRSSRHWGMLIFSGRDPNDQLPETDARLEVSPSFYFTRPCRHRDERAQPIRRLARPLPEPEPGEALHSNRGLTTSFHQPCEALRLHTVDDPIASAAPVTPAVEQ